MSITRGEALDQLHRTVGVLVPGYVLSMVFYGFNAYQIYIYFSSVKEEHALRKWAVIILAVLDSTSVGTLTQYVHFYIIQEFPNVLPAVTFATKEFCADNAIAVIMVFIVQAVYANQFMRYTTPGAVFVVILALAALGLGLAMSGLMIEAAFPSLGSNPIKAIIGTSQFLTFVAGLATSVIFFLQDNGQDYRGLSERMWYDGFVEVTFERLGIATLLQMGYFIAFVVWPQDHFWIPFQMVTRRVFTLSLLTLLNNRAVTQGRVVLDHPSDSASSAASTTIQLSTRGKSQPQMNVSKTYVSDGDVESTRKGAEEDSDQLKPDVFHITVTRSVEHDPPTKDKYGD